MKSKRLQIIELLHGKKTDYKDCEVLADDILNIAKISDLALIEIIAKCPISHEKQKLISVKGKESGFDYTEIITKGESTAWRHKITSEEINLCGCGNAMEQPKGFQKPICIRCFTNKA